MSFREHRKQLNPGLLEPQRFWMAWHSEHQKEMTSTQWVDFSFQVSLSLEAVLSLPKKPGLSATTSYCQAKTSRHKASRNFKEKEKPYPVPGNEISIASSEPALKRINLW